MNGQGYARCRGRTKVKDRPKYRVRVQTSLLGTEQPKEGGRTRRANATKCYQLCEKDQDKYSGGLRSTESRPVVRSNGELLLGQVSEHPITGRGRARVVREERDLAHFGAVLVELDLYRERTRGENSG
jgi:hypothetical protein